MMAASIAMVSSNNNNNSGDSTSALSCISLHAHHHHHHHHQIQTMNEDHEASSPDERNATIIQISGSFASDASTSHSIGADATVDDGIDCTPTDDIRLEVSVRSFA